MSDVYNPSECSRHFLRVHRPLMHPKEHIFIGGVFALGFISLGAGFAASKIPLIVLRALSGVGK